MIMNINFNSKINFKSYIPVVCYARNKGEENFRRVYYSPEDNYLTRCQGNVVRNLNGTLKNKNDKFIDFYKKQDKDYSSNPFVTSVYDKEESFAYLVTGRDADKIKNFGKTIGLSKKYNPKKFQGAKQDYFYNAFDYIENSCKQVKSKDGDELYLKVYFDAKRNKRDEVTSFELVNAKFEKDV